MAAPATPALTAPSARGLVLHAPGVTRDRRLRGELAAAQVLEAVGLQTWQIAQAARAAVGLPPYPIEPAEAQAAIRLAEHVAFTACYGTAPWPPEARLNLAGSLH